MESLKTSIEHFSALGEVERNPEARSAFVEFRDALTRGKIRAAEKIDGQWRVNTWVKHGVLLGFRLGELAETGCAPLTFVDKDTFPARQFSLEDRVRVVPG
jgi:2,3,4,5-tetrahydropyridine-2,6-dicarboxylate N-succinyltransferase